MIAPHRSRLVDRNPRPNLRVLRAEDTARLKLPPFDYHAHRARSRRFSLLVIAGALVGGGLVAAVEWIARSL